VKSFFYPKSRSLGGLLALALLAGLAGGQTRAAATKARGWLDPLLYPESAARMARGLGDLEITHMLRALAAGGNMGPGQGWFKPSTSRYGWDWLADRHDADRDGTITRRELGHPRAFAALDRDGDGVLTPDDFDWSPRSRYLQKTQPARMWFSMADGDSNGQLSRAEWEALFRRASGGKGFLTADDLARAFPLERPRRRQPEGKPSRRPAGGGPTLGVLLQGLLDGDLGSPFEGPAVGERAPNFTLPTQDGKEHIALRDYRGKKPVVLVFGNFT
jgi:hypothetical protein